MSKEPPRLVCLGNFTIDDVYQADGSFVPQCMGGDALYAALGARLWEPQVELLAPLGNDIPKRILEAIRAIGFNLAALPVRDIPTIHNRIFYDAMGGRRWEVLASDQAFNILSPEPGDIPGLYLMGQAILILAMTLEAQENLIGWLKTHTRAMLALDTQEDYVIGNEERVLHLISQVDVFMPSAVEVVQLIGQCEWLDAAWKFAKMGPKVVVIKCGEEGVFVLNRDTGEWFMQDPISRKVVDTTGAGDAFCGGFMAAYVQRPDDLRRAALAGSISASFAIASFGMDALLDAKPEDALLHLQEIRDNRSKNIAP
jgi:sugar/nucleoside kinase (ribokinase family)